VTPGAPGPLVAGSGAQPVPGLSHQVSCDAVRRTARQSDQRESEFHVYAIVRAGGRQEKVSVGDVVTVDRIAGEPGSTVELKPLLLVDGSEVTSDVTSLSGVRVTAEIVAATKGPKIHILKFKNKTGYRKRQGHRQRLTQLKVIGIER
jgi:large subunit ribosomal protein L21